MNGLPVNTKAATTTQIFNSTYQIINGKYKYNRNINTKQNNTNTHKQAYCYSVDVSPPYRDCVV